MRSRIINRIFFYSIFTVFCLSIGYLITFPHHFWQASYSLEVRYQRLFEACSDNAPVWMEDALTHAVGAQGALSAQIAYISPNGMVAHCEIGTTGRKWFESVTEHDRYRLASLTKIVTLDGALRLQAQGMFNWNDKLVSLLPSVQKYKDERVKQITLKDLALHRSGLGRSDFSGDIMFGRKNPWCPGSLEEIANQKLRSNPGEKYAYANVGYCLLGQVMSQVAGKSYSEYMKQEYFLEKYNLKFAQSNYYADEIVYDFRFDPFFNERSRFRDNFEALQSSAGLTGSAKNFALLLRDILGKQVQYSSPALRDGNSPYVCNAKNICIDNGMYIYKPAGSKNFLRFHEGHIAGSASVAIQDEWGGVVVLAKNSRNRPQQNQNDNWVPWFYEKLMAHYQEYPESK